MIGAHVAHKVLEGGVDLCRQRVLGDQSLHGLNTAPVEGGEHVVGQAAQFYVVHVDHLAQGAVVARGELIEHVLVGGARGPAQDRLQILWQRRQRLGANDELQDGTRLVPARVIVILGDLVQPQSEIVVGADPFHGVDHPGLQGGVHLAAGNAHRLAARGAEHFAGQARNAHTQTLEVGHGVDFTVEPAGHLHAGAAAGQRHDPGRRVDFFPQGHAVAVVQPAVHFLRGHAEGHGGKENRRGNFTLPVIRGAVAHLRHARGHGIEDLEGRDDLARPVHADIQAAVAHLAHVVGEHLGRVAQAGQVLRPGGHELPANRLARRRGAGPGRGSVAIAGALRGPQSEHRHQGRGQQQHGQGLAIEGALVVHARACNLAYCTTSHFVPGPSKFTSTRAPLPRPSKFRTTPSPNIGW